MGKGKLIKRDGFLFVIAICVAVVMTFSVSSAKLATRNEYTFKIAMAEHFSFSAGEFHSFEIPYDGYYAFQLWGGDGGNSKNSWWSGEGIYEFGGNGGYVAAVSFFSKGTILVIAVGTKGGTTNGGFNGGGDGGSHSVPVFNFYFGGGGGGATDVRLSAGALDDRILVAGGGGGSSAGDGSNFPPTYGGDGGAHGENYAGSNGNGSGYGQGGGLISGGDGYQFGGFGYGGNGTYSGGGGGGGYYGGGGAYGSGGGGGGGSAYISDTFMMDAPEGLPDISTYITDVGDGYAIISFLGSKYTGIETYGDSKKPTYDVGEPFTQAEEPSGSVNSIPESISES